MARKIFELCPPEARRHLSRGLSAAAVGAVLLAGCAGMGTAQIDPDQPYGDLNLRVNGIGAWTVDCEARNRQGRRAVAEAQGKGRSHFEHLFLSAVVSAECTYAAGDGPLEIRMVDERMACPFETDCVLTVGAGATGDFTLMPKAAAAGMPTGDEPGAAPAPLAQPD